jgi:inhibitor of KinA sporulation pathway (predicted exonuclease)
MQKCVGHEHHLSNPGPVAAFDYYVVLDFEATCSEQRSGRGSIPPNQQEIIELPSVLVNAKTGEIEGEFQRYVKPVLCPKLTKFCTTLTGIDQATVNAGVSIVDALSMHLMWLHSCGLSGSPGYSWAFVTCGDWDLQSMLQRQLQQPHCKGKIKLPEPYKRWVNIKKAFKAMARAGNKRYSTKIGGMTTMLDKLGLELQGRHHSGIDDCRNIARILIEMLKDGSTLELTSGHSSSVTGMGCCSLAQESFDNAGIGDEKCVGSGSGSSSGSGIQITGAEPETHRTVAPICLSPRMIEYIPGMVAKNGVQMFWGHSEEVQKVQVAVGPQHSRHSPGPACLFDPCISVQTNHHACDVLAPATIMPWSLEVRLESMFFELVPCCVHCAATTAVWRRRRGLSQLQELGAGSFCVCFAQLLPCITCKSFSVAFEC